jgi:X-Pro dipeptidyl-peptidase
MNSDGALIAENMHEWIDHFLYGIENGVVDKLPNYSVQSSSNSTWAYYDQWPLGKYKKYYPTGGRVGQLSETPQTSTTSLTFKDVFQLGLTRPVQAAPSAPAFVPNFSQNAALHAGQGTVMSGTQFTRWKNYITGGNDSTTSWVGGGVNRNAPTALTADWTKELEDRVLFITEVPEEMTISGVIKMTATVAADKNYGALSAMVIDIGMAPRTTTGTTTTGAKSIRLANGNSQMLNFHTTTTNPYAIVSRGSVDIRNPNPDRKIWPQVPGMDFADTFGGNWNPNYLYQTVDIKPGEFHEYTWELDVMEYTVRAGHKLGVILYGSDPEYTYLPPNANAVTEFTVNLGPGTYLSLPIIGYVVPVTSLVIDAPVLTTVGRGATFGLTVTVEPEDASTDGIIWSVTDETFAKVNNDGLITTKNKTGTVLLTATAPSGAKGSIVLRIV